MNWHCIFKNENSNKIVCSIIHNRNLKQAKMLIPFVQEIIFILYKADNFTEFRLQPFCQNVGMKYLILALEIVSKFIKTFVRFLQTVTTAIAQSMCHLASRVYDSLRAYKLPLTGTKLFLTGLKSRNLW